MHFVCGFCNGNAKAALVGYGRRFPKRNVRNPRVFTYLHNRLRETGSFSRRKRDGFDAIEVHTEKNIIELVQQRPGTRFGRLSNLHVVSTSQV